VTNDIETLIKMGIETNAGAVKAVIRKKKDGTPLRIVCVYFEFDELEKFLDDLETLEEKYGLGT
jgi:transcriptional regulator NrdR family protein